MKMPTMNKPTRRRPRSEDVAYVKHSVARATGLKVSLDRLDADELIELKMLVDEIRASGASEGVERCDPGSLDDVDKLRRWEGLVAAAAAKPSDYFDRERERAAAAAAEAERARRPSKHPRFEEAGMIVIPPEVFRGLQDGGLGAVHLLVLTLVFGMIENKASLHRFATVVDDAVIVPNVESLVAAVDFEGDISGVGRAVRELEDAGLLIIERHGDVTIRLGTMLADALKRRQQS